MNVYGPSMGPGRPKLWEELKDVLSVWSLPCLIFGDFNLVRSFLEWRGFSSTRREIHCFNNFVDQFNLLELD